MFVSPTVLRASAAITDPGDGPTPSCVEWRQYTLGDFSLQLRVVSLSCRRNSQNGHAMVSLEKRDSVHFPSPQTCPHRGVDPGPVETQYFVPVPPSPKEERWCVVIDDDDGKRVPLRTFRCGS